MMNAPLGLHGDPASAESLEVAGWIRGQVADLDDGGDGDRQPPAV